MPYMEQVSCHGPHMNNMITIYGTGIVWSPHMYIWSTTCMIWWSCLTLLSMTLMVPHTLYGIGIWWSPLPYTEQVSYGPPYVCMVPQHISSEGPPYLIWNMYHMVPPHVWSDGLLLTLYGTVIIWSPHVYMIFFQASFKRGPLHVLINNKTNANKQAYAKIAEYTRIIHDRYKGFSYMMQ